MKVKTLVVSILTLVLLTGTALAQIGDNVVSTGGGTANSMSIIDASVFVPTGTDACSQISQAITQAAHVNGVASATIDARGITNPSGGTLNCLSNPFSSVSTYPLTGRLLLGSAIWATTVQWQIPNRWWVEGIGLSEQSSSLTPVNSIIRAASGFSCTGGTTINGNCPVVFIGPPAANTFAAGINKLTVDCSNLTGCIGAGSSNVQEGGGVDTVAFINQTTACVDFDTPTSGGSGFGISNSFIRNVNCTFGSNPASNAIGILITGATAGPAEISNTSVTTPGGATVIQDCLYLDGGTGTNINYFHCEHAGVAEVLGSTVSAPPNNYQTIGANIHGLTTSNTPVGIVLNVESGTLPPVASAPGTSIQGVYMQGVSSTTLTVLEDNGSNLTISGPGVGQNALLTQYGSAPVNLLTPATLGNLNGLGSVPNGTVGYCSNCQSPSSPCANSGTGALAVRQNGAWVCK